jgi:hypothetical protein
MQLLSFHLRVGLYSENLTQCSLLATGDQNFQSYQSKSDSKFEGSHPVVYGQLFIVLVPSLRNI